MNKPLLYSLAALVILAAAAGGYVYYRHSHPFEYDPRLKTALLAVQNPASYQEASATRTIVSDREIDISGLYRLDFNARAYASYATTTLIIPDQPATRRKHTFSLENIAIGSDVYVRIQTTSPLLKKTIPNGPEWHHFAATSIPSQFANIAIPGPVLNDLALLSGNGRYLHPAQSAKNVTLGGKTYALYRFTLSKDAFAQKGGTLETLVQRIATGTVDLWIGPDGTLSYMAFHGDNYESTSTIDGMNAAFPIAPPVASQ